MIKIPTENIKLIEFEYLLKIKNFFKYNEPNKDKLIALFKGKKDLESKMLKYFHDHIDKIILAPPSEIRNIQIDFIDNLKLDLVNNNQHKIQFTRFKERMEKYFNSFFQRKMSISGIEYTYGRWLTKAMNVKVCPYCNHNYIFTINIEKKENVNNKISSRPQLDHYLPKAKYPILALSIYNLIPCCTVCNKIKAEKEFSFYPYDTISREKVMFKVKSEGNYNPNQWVTGLGKTEIELEHYDETNTLNSSTDMNTIIKQLGLAEVYNEHVEYVEEILDKIFAYNHSYYDAMISSYEGLGKTSAQIESIIWSAYLDKVGDRPMSKLTNDILSQLKIKRI
ncbi:hypothetical protein [Cloacibacterium normanense]|uniref:hypothetical protein n=1 Tax=Cloacibacterium normanense TaxID=237258 RepID=UPI00391DCB45